MEIGTKKKINIITCPVRALYATLVLCWVELLTLGSLPWVKKFWLYFYQLWEFNEEEM